MFNLFTTLVQIVALVSTLVGIRAGCQLLMHCRLLRTDMVVNIP